MSERDELPEGWSVIATPSGLYVLIFPDGRTWTKLSSFEAIAAAWRIVDAEQEAGDGR